VSNLLPDPGQQRSFAPLGVPHKAVQLFPRTHLYVLPAATSDMRFPLCRITRVVAVIAASRTFYKAQLIK
jgi:hypothetical protein